MKFKDAIDEWLYSVSFVDAEEGSVVESGWYGRYDAPSMSDAEEETEDMNADQIAFVRGVKAGAILCEATDGSVSSEYFDDQAAFEEAWERITGPARPRYTVVVGNIGTVYDGDDEATAKEKFDDYIERSKSNVGRAGGEEVSLFLDDDLIQEHAGTREAE